MHNTLLASVLKIYVGGLVVFLPDVPEKGTLRLVLLQGDVEGSAELKHVKPVGAHSPSLVAAASDVCFAANAPCTAKSEGYMVTGGVGEQVATFELAYKVAAAGALATAKSIDLSPADLVGVGSNVSGAMCPAVKTMPAFKERVLEDKWPVAAYLDLAGVQRVAYDDERLQTIALKGTQCPASTITAADRIVVDVALADDASPTFKWKRGRKEEQAVLKKTTRRVSIWNLPHQHDPSSDEGANHLAAYFSLLTDKTACDCFVDQKRLSLEDPRATEPVFCPPSEEKP